MKIQIYNLNRELEERMMEIENLQAEITDMKYWKGDW
jgi:hypothetical protein